MPLRNQAPLAVSLDAPPFKPVTCSVPPMHLPLQGAFNPCVLREDYSPARQQPVLLLSILLGLVALPPTMQQQVLAMLHRAAAFEAETTTPSPSYIPLRLASDGDITTKFTEEPLQASASLAPGPLTTLQGDPYCDGQLCYTAFAAPASAARLWAMSVPVALHWRFTSAERQAVSEVAYPVIEGWPVDLTYIPAIGWRVSQVLNPGASAAGWFSRLSCAAGAALLQAQTAHLGWTIQIAHQAGMQGCQLVGHQEQADLATFFWRFGVLLAADATAQRLLPALPLALPADDAAIRA